ncbi:hypothetical protein FISHEDRAFT_49481 [Fistulina hepatica ATCC 64428]|uniref:ARID domain-containing protein n=1 Tax=Fistulina hepatica ATCC 64428 TaxID=1128425 RepID=A0A0D7A3Y8_9AGAR|nr:hypothetical protein FISHEDRAFT_49481 [Fistulina hepatica ATCC 64428]
MGSTTANAGPSSGFNNIPAARGSSVEGSRQFLLRLSQFHANRGVPLPPFITGIPIPGYDPNNTPWSFLEPSSEPASFRLAGKDVNILRLFGAVIQHRAMMTSQPGATPRDIWPSITQNFDLPPELPQPVNGVLSTAQQLERIYGYLLQPMEATYNEMMRNMAMQRRAELARQQAGLNVTPIQRNGVSSSDGRPQSSSSNKMPLPSTNGDEATNNLKRKLEEDDGNPKHARQKTEPLDGPAPSVAGSVPLPTPQFKRPARRKIEYVPLAREVETYGGRDLAALEHEYVLSLRRPFRDINSWGLVEIDHLVLSLRSRMSTELSYALTTLNVLSILRARNSTSGFEVKEAPDLIDEVVDLIEDVAFEGYEDLADEEQDILTNRHLIRSVYETETEVFAGLQTDKQGFLNLHADGLKQRPGNVVRCAVNVLKNLAFIPDNVEHLAKNERMLDVLLRLCVLKKPPESSTFAPASRALNMSDLIDLRKDILGFVGAVAPAVVLGSISSPMTCRIARRFWQLSASYLTDPTDSVSPSLYLHSHRIPFNSPRATRPPSNAELALDAFTSLTRLDQNRRVFRQVISGDAMFTLFSSLLRRLPLVDVDFQLVSRETWLAYVERVLMAMYSIAFFSPTAVKKRIVEDRALGYRTVMLRVLERMFLSGSPDARQYYAVATRRAVETVKLIDDVEADPAVGGEENEDQSGVGDKLAFGVGYGEFGDNAEEHGLGMFCVNRDVLLTMLSTTEVCSDEVMFKELESLVRIESNMDPAFVEEVPAQVL